MSTKKSAKATIATGIVNEIILERFLINFLPTPRQFDLKKVNNVTGFDYYSIRKYISSDLYAVTKKTIDITYDDELLSTKSKAYVEHLIKKAVFPAKYEDDEMIYYTLKLFDSSYFSEEEKAFIDLMTNEFFSIVDYKEFTIRLHPKVLFEFNSLNRCPFIYNAKNIYNDIIRQKIRAGDNVMKYIQTYLTDEELAKLLEQSCEFDFFFDKNGILKCDLNTNRNILIKNFLNTILHELTDIPSRIILLMKLNSRYPFLIREKIFNEFN